MTQSFILTFSCPDGPGISMGVTSFIFHQGGNVTESQQFNAHDSGRFFMRIIFEVAPDISIESIRKAFGPLATEKGMDWDIRDVNYQKKVLLFVSKFDHCLGDILYRHRIGDLKMDVVGIVSNHPKSALNLTLMDGIPYHHFPISKSTKPEQEARIKALVNETGAELIVLARYMQILSDDLCTFLEGRCINIHHSFLPGFKGARPYHQAFDRGVKMIGATAHFVTTDLDEGPIICQDVVAITHNDTPNELIKHGRDVERRVLSRAVNLILQDRVFLNGSKTVVF